MPIVANNTENIVEPTVVTKEVTPFWEVTDFSVDVRNRSILIGLEKGYLDANNEYHRLASKRTRLEGQDFLIMAQAITTGSSLYNEIKSSLYSILQAKGEVAGTVS